MPLPVIAIDDWNNAALLNDHSPRIVDEMGPVLPELAAGFCHSCHTGSLTVVEKHPATSWQYDVRWYAFNLLRAAVTADPSKYGKFDGINILAIGNIFMCNGTG